MWKEFLKIRKKDGTLQAWNSEKIVIAVGKSAERINVKFNEEQIQSILGYVEGEIGRIQLESGTEEIPVKTVHALVEAALEQVEPMVAKSYKDYRNYRKDIARMMEEGYQEDQKIRYLGDKSNANTDSALVSTQRALCYNNWNTKLYEKFFLTNEELQAQREGYIYIHDRSARRDTMNCCLFDVESVLKGGFEMGSLWYNEPKTLDVAFDVIGDMVLSAAAQQYGGFTIPEMDKILGPYAKKTHDRQYKKYFQLFMSDKRKTVKVLGFEWDKLSEDVKQEFWQQADAKAKEEAEKDVLNEFEQGWQGLEYKFNSVGSSRGDYPFVTITFGLGTERFEKMATISALEVRRKGQGKKGFKKPVVFPKLVFLYDEDLHGPRTNHEDLFEAGVACSAKAMYPDWLSLTGDGYVASVYKKYGRVISPMGCRAMLSLWFERGGMEPADEDDKPVFVGRFNCGVVSLHLPMILAKARRESKDFYEVLDYYMHLIRGLHKRTMDYLGELKAGCNPLAYCEGGFYGGHLKPEEKIKPLLKSATISFGITALNELQRLYDGKSLVEGGAFALEVMQYINDKVTQFKKEDGILYAVYGTPAESLCGLQVKQFREQFGIVENVSDRAYVSNSFHCHVTEDITPIQKQDLEGRFWDLLNGGKIQYVRYNIGYNKEAIRTLIRRAMKMGFYEGVNLALNYCENCGYEQVDMKDACPKCGSKNITKIDRMNGYLSFSRSGRLNRDAIVDEDGIVTNLDENGNTIVMDENGEKVIKTEAKEFDATNTGRFNTPKNIEIGERVSM